MAHWDTTIEVQSSPVRIPIAGPAVSLVAADDFACALLATGAVTCWGKNNSGQLDAPQRDVVAIDAGTGAACALLRDGDVTCWGNLKAPDHRLNARSVHVGWNVGCALLHDDTMTCWGYEPPTFALGGVAQLALDQDISCARMRDGTVQCWGRAGDPEEQTPSVVNGVVGAIDLDVSKKYGCAVTRDGDVMCWGERPPGIHDDGKGDSVPATRVALSAPFVEIAAGHEHACGRTRDGATQCWGWNNRAQVSGSARPGFVLAGTTVELVDRPAVTPPAPSGAPTPPTITQLRSGARRYELALDSLETLTAAGWTGEGNEGATFAADGRLVLHGGHAEMWNTTEFVKDAGNPPGWAVEARMKTDGRCARSGTGLWITDGYHHVVVVISATTVDVWWSKTDAKDIGPTNVMRTYRVELVGSTLTVKVDGVVAMTTTAQTNSAAQRLSFGSLDNGCTYEESTWESIAYETFPTKQLAWPPRDQFHPNVPSKPLLDILAAKLPSLGELPAVPDDLAACVALIALDGAVRELPLAHYRSTRQDAAVKALAAMDLVDGNLRRSSTKRVFAALDLRGPAFLRDVQAAVSASFIWQEHPRRTELAVETIADIYARALAENAPGAKAAIKHLATRLRALKRRPKTCGLAR